MTSLDTPGSARLAHPRSIPSFPFAETIDVAAAGIGADEPSPCLPCATAVWYELRPPQAGTLIIDLAGSTPRDVVVRLYRRRKPAPVAPEFVGCASPVWNGRLSLELTVGADETVLAQVGTAASRDGRIVVRAEMRAESRAL